MMTFLFQVGESGSGHNTQVEEETDAPDDMDEEERQVIGKKGE